MIGHDITAALPGLRAEAESLLTDRCDLQRKAGATTDPATLAQTPIWVTYATDVPCRLRRGETQPSVATAGAQALSELRATLSVPVSTAGICVDDRAVVTATGDESLAGVALYVRGIPRGSQMVLRRLPVSEVQ